MEVNPVWIKNLVVPRRKEETFKNDGWIFICYVQLTSNCGDNLHSSTSGLIIVVQLQLYSFIFILFLFCCLFQYRFTIDCLGRTEVKCTKI